MWYNGTRLTRYEDNTYNVICRWPIIIDCARLKTYGIHDKEVNRRMWEMGIKSKSKQKEIDKCQAI